MATEPSPGVSKIRAHVAVMMIQTFVVRRLGAIYAAAKAHSW